MATGGIEGGALEEEIEVTLPSKGGDQPRDARVAQLAQDDNLPSRGVLVAQLGDELVLEDFRRVPATWRCQGR